MRLELDQPANRYPLQDISDANSQPSSNDNSDIVKRGIAAARSGNRSQARILLKHAVELVPDNELAWLWLASISEYPEELMVFLDHVLLINPGNRRAVEWKSATEFLLAKTFVQRGIDAASEGRKVQAKQWFNEALKYDEQNQTAWDWMASLQDVQEKEIQFSDAVAEISESTEPPLTEQPEISSEHSYTPPHSESVVLHPLKTYKDNEDGPTQELVLPESLLESNPFESYAEEIPAPPESFYVPDMTVAQPEVHSYEEPAPIEESAVYVEDSWTAESFLQPIGDDCDIQEVLAAASFEEFGDVGRDADEFDSEGSQSEQWLTSAPPQTSDHSVDIDEGFCPFCESEAGNPAIFCASCEAMLTLSDIDAILSHTPSDPSKLRSAVQLLVGRRNDGNLDSESLVNLAIGYLNLGEMDAALSCLREASSADPNNVVISSELNTLAIRIDEIRNHEERFTSIPTGKTILVVDDSPTIRKLISGKLEKGGHEVFCAEDGVQAVELLKNLTPDLILLDITMPRMDGYQVCKSIRSSEKSKNVPVVMISGKDGFFDKVRGKMAGASDYITKPFGPEALIKALGKYLHDDIGEVEAQNDLD